MLSIFNLAGGVTYHYLALKYRNKLWSQFRHKVSQELQQWAPEQQKLILVGPSAGYSLPAAFLQRFEKIEVVEIDAIAKKIFKYRFSEIHTEVNFVSDNLFEQNGRFSLTPFENYLSKKQDYAVLFCNFVGQVGIVANTPSEVKVKLYLKQIEEMLQGFNVFSYHDRLSFEIKRFNLNQANNSLIQMPLHRNFDETARTVCKYMDTKVNSISMIDHGTEEFLSGNYVSSTIWEIYPNKFHWIDFNYK